MLLFCRGKVTVVEEHLKHHKHVQKMYEELLADVPGVKVKGQEDAYKTIVTGAVGGAAGVIHAAVSAHTDCEPNANVEAMRVALDKAQIEARPVWKPMHKQPCYLQGNVTIENVGFGRISRLMVHRRADMRSIQP